MPCTCWAELASTVERCPSPNMVQAVCISGARGYVSQCILRCNAGHSTLTAQREMPLTQGWLMQHSHHCSAHPTSRLQSRPLAVGSRCIYSSGLQSVAASRLIKEKSQLLATRAPFRPFQHCRRPPPCKATNDAAFDTSDNEKPQHAAADSATQSGYLQQQWAKYSESFAKIAASTRLQLSAVLNPKFLPMVLL